MIVGAVVGAVVGTVFAVLCVEVAQVAAPQVVPDAFEWVLLCAGFFALVGAGIGAVIHSL